MQRLGVPGSLGAAHLAGDNACKCVLEEGRAMAEWWAAHWDRVLTIAGFVLGVIGLIGIYFSYMGWKRKKPYYLIRSTNIFTGIDHMVPNVEVKFPGYGPTIKALTVTKIALWNAGSETIKKADIVKGD